MKHAIQVDEIRTPGALAGLAEEWWELWQRSPAATPFQSPAWLIAWWNAFAPGRLMSVALRKGGRLIALAPLYLENGPLGQRLLPIGIALSDYIDVLIDPDAEGAAEAIVQHLSHVSGWDGLELADLAPDAAALALACPAACADRIESSGACLVLYLTTGCGDAGSYPAIPARQRRSLRMARHRLKRSPGAAVTPTAGRTAGDWVSLLTTLHAVRWQSRGEPGVLADPRVQDFHRQALPGLLERGLARLFALSIGDEIVGLYYGFLHRRRAYAYLGGFDPAFAYYSPGTILIGHAIEDALRENVCEFDFLRGRETYKYAWGAVDRPTLTRTFLRQRAHA